MPPGPGPFHNPFDWERDHVFDGYDPVEDGSAYPMPEPEQTTGCTCTVVPPRTLAFGATLEAVVSICDFCFDRLTAEAA